MLCSGAYGLTSCYPDWLLPIKGVSNYPTWHSQQFPWAKPGTLYYPYSKSLLETTLAKNWCGKEAFCCCLQTLHQLREELGPAFSRGCLQRLQGPAEPPANPSCAEQAATSSTFSQRSTANWVRGQHCNSTWTWGGAKVWQQQLNTTGFAAGAERHQPNVTSVDETSLPLRLCLNPGEPY